jgi:transcription elongation factor Elf1
LQQAITKVAVKPEEVKKTVNRSTFACPLCSEKNLERKGLLEHVRKKHKGKPAVCPICVVQAYGDPNYVS